MRSKQVRSIFVAMAAVLVALSFFELGIWQLHRALEVKRLSQPGPEQPVVELRTLATASTNLSGTAINRMVRFTGKYSHQYLAPNQEVKIRNQAGQLIKVVATLDVGLFELTPLLSDLALRHDSILVVRGISSQDTKSLELPLGQLTITGRLYPHQNTDHASQSDIRLSRIDPALIAGISDIQLFDGYVGATREQTRSGKEVSFSRMATPQLLTQVPGYYWQHISYLVIWWFMALLVLFGPIYSRKVKKDKV